MTPEDKTKLCIEHHTTDIERKVLKEKYNVSSMYKLDHIIRNHTLDKRYYPEISKSLKK